MITNNVPTRFIEIARKMALMSNSPDYRHGAILVKGGSILSTSSNKNRHIRWGTRFRKRDCGHATQHAELGCILGIDRSVTSGSVIYVVRVNKKGVLRMSKPCEMCQSVLSHVGIKKVVYSADDGQFGSIRL